MSVAVPIPPEVVDAIAELAARKIEEARREYLTTEEAAAYLKMSTNRLDKLCSGAIKTEVPSPFRREGRRRIFVRQELDEWVDDGGSGLA